MKPFINISHETCRICSMKRWQALGLVGEIIAATYFLIRGYRLEGWRRRFGKLEADLIFSRRKETLLIEVKSGGLSGCVTRPEKQMGPRKIKNLEKITRSLGIKSREVFVELVAVDFSKIIPKIRRYRRVCLW